MIRIRRASACLAGLVARIRLLEATAVKPVSARTHAARHNAVAVLCAAVVTVVLTVVISAQDGSGRDFR